MKRIAILGSTGSIGTQAIDIVSRYPDRFCVEALTAGNNAELLISQALKTNPSCVVIANKDKYSFVKQALKDTDIKVFAGSESIEDVAGFSTNDMVLNALVGFAGLKPTISAIKANKPVALANKETMVVGGELIVKLAAEHNVPILPVDSEHSAIFQCLNGEYLSNIRKIYLTASGGAFYGKKREELKDIKPKDALKNPNWTMGAKVTIDSATLMNKGLEIIEARWLFGVDANKIIPVIHRQSLVHSMVEYVDGSIKAQIGKTDMRLPILYALSYPERLETDGSLAIDIFSVAPLTFAKPDYETFPCLNLAISALQNGGNMPCAMNAANEEAVKLFLNEKIGFLDISDVVEKGMALMDYIKNPSFEDLHQTDLCVREKIREKYL